ncbi:MAG TPA: DNA polymerase III subunit alpha [Actinobacteria bacterium]|nr:DNA polymerase III subunit alpha [Actinomycetota bacterium]
MSNFVHLHTHSEYSLLDGAARTKDLVNRAKELGMPALALTDHGVMYGIIDFYEAAKKADLKPIIGCEVYVAPRSRFDKSFRKGEDLYHLVLLAENNEGYKNLMRLVSLGFLEGFYYKPRVDKEILEKYHQGLIALSGCIGGEIAKLILSGNIEKAKKVALAYKDIFGEKNFFLEIQDQGLKEQKTVNKILIEFSKDLEIPLIATNDIHYVKKNDNLAQDVLLCIQTGSFLDDENRLKFSSDGFYFKSQKEMEKIFSDVPEAIENSLKIANRCNVSIDFDQMLLPHYEVSENYTLESYLDKLAREGIKERYHQITSEIEERLNHELDVIKKMGFAGYFLVVWDFVKFAKDNGIRVGPGRGSAAGSIVSYALKITDIDPLKHDLLFERFLNPERVSMPDIDIDFCIERRGEVIDYVSEKYGKENVAQIITFGTMAARAAIRDAGRVFGYPYGMVDKIAKLIPETPGITIDEALKLSPELAEECKNDKDTAKIIETAKALEGLARQDSIHAAGVVISRGPLTDYTPIQKKGDAETVTQYHMDAVRKIGLLKMDFLGLRTLTVTGKALNIIKRTNGVDINIDNIPFDDEKTFRMLQRGESVGVFQLESSGMRGLLRDLQPTSFEDVVGLLALYRPGPLGSGMVKDFVDRKHGRSPATYPHPSTETILKDTYGIIVYQEQVMRIASTMAGFSMAEADILRVAMSKKKPEVLAEQREKFIGGAISKEIDAKTAGDVFDLVLHFAGYGFNKSHSTAYAVVAYQTAYLKANFPVEFMAALLTSVMHTKDKVPRYINECRQLGIEVLPPDVNESFSGFTVVGDSIRFGLAAVRNVGEGPVEAIVKARKKNSSFKSLYDFCERVDLGVINKKCLEGLIKGGAFDFCGISRRALMEMMEQAVEIGQRKQKDKEIGQITLFDLNSEEEAVCNGTINNIKEYPKDQLLAYEKEMLGLYVSDHPLLSIKDALKSQVDVSISELKEQKDGGVVWIGGLISRIKRITTRKGETMLFVSLEDLEGDVEVVVFSSMYQKYRELVEEDKIIRLKGRIDIKEDEVKIIALEIEPLDVDFNPASEVPSVFIKMQSASFTKKIFERLKEILRAYSGGSSPVFLQVASGKKMTTMRLGKNNGVKIDGTLFSELKELLGEDAVFVKHLKKAQ